MDRIRSGWSLGRVVGFAGALSLLALAPLPAGAEHQTATLTLSPTSDRNPLGTNHVITATAANAVTFPIDIDFEITAGPNAIQGLDAQDNDTSQADFTCVLESSANLSCPINYTDTRATPGETDTIVAWIDHDRDDSTFEGAAATVTKTWGGQLGARQLALLSGPVGLVERSCAVDRLRRGGEVASIARLCLTEYLVEEADPEQDYGVLWLQANVKARRGFCTTRVRSDLRLPGGVLVGAMAPEGVLVVDGRAVGSTELRFDVPEAGMEVGVTQTYYVYSGRMVTRSLEDEEGGVWRLLWRKGETRKKTAFAHGFAYSWPGGEGPPELTDPAELAHRLAVKRRCAG